MYIFDHVEGYKVGRPTDIHLTKFALPARAALDLSKNKKR
jgi:hypothetical protein